VLIVAIGIIRYFKLKAKKYNYNLIRTYTYNINNFIPVSVDSKTHTGFFALTRIFPILSRSKCFPAFPGQISLLSFNNTIRY
jgi:hypothetical protein